MESLSRDLRIAVRQLLKSPGFTLIAVLMLAFGIGATTAIFSIVEGVLLRPLPFPEPDRLVVLGDILQGAGISPDSGGTVTAPDVRNYTRDTNSFTSLGGYNNTNFELSGSGDPAIVYAARLSAGVFPALGVAPLLGRVFTQEEDEGHQQLVVLGYPMWQDRFHGDPHIIGKKILLDRKPYVVIGVMPAGFEFPIIPGHLDRSELWVPMSFAPDQFLNGASNWGYRMVGRLRRGVTSARATEDAERVAEETMRSYPGFMRSLHIRAKVTPLQDDAVHEVRVQIRTLFLAVLVVLLIACANLAGLLLVRAIRRQRELAVRIALGAGATTLLRQTVLESMVLTVSGGVVGLVMAAVALRVGRSLLPETLPRLNEIGLDWVVVGFAMLLALVTGGLCGLAPAFAAIRTSVSAALKEGGRMGTLGGGFSRLRSALVIAEIAVAMALLTASGLLLRSFEKMRSVELGFRPDHLDVGAYSLPRKQYATQAAVNEFDDEMLRRLARLPGVKAVGLTNAFPASGFHSSNAFVVEGYTPPKNAGLSLASALFVEGDYFRAMGISLLRGRLFTPEDKSDSQLVVIVNQKLAEHYWPGQDPVGKRMRLGLPETPTPWLVVVGVVGDVKLGSPDEETTDQMYEPATQEITAAGTLVTAAELAGDVGYITVRTELAPEQMENAIRATVQSIDSQLPLTQVQTMEHAVSGSETSRKFNTALISAFAAAAVVLAVLGVYSVIAFSVALRAHELAIRMALGSQRGAIVRLVLISGAKLGLAGCAIGLVAALAASQLLQSLLFEVSAFDPAVLGLAALTVISMTLMACLLPARRAASTDPLRALRAE
ncbi:Macrolide-specific ABC-type efflux carrier [Acidisarcina polymorpha]|uniref:Macrolide-specific ABC-type efflux carrier n=1 Tax=Acidisarcina polymorpha TaxID=2211140 RepID=A0A2Z5FUN4_9BACT|nr:ABC transporter permease [Acidisarcina polymorpha]AXC10571.1 Macrolide-specific ABC-type efflux carrier [Acidisarcina polymorpha]